ncbi:hypothetical protein TSUD_340980 [Trifolium subterraneum]|uniref:Uncharacterized protein n=1 Tax=Trifolium subterraneum TaxID=3900 RepID=A0A2Z6M6L6_TRISU|nr:hypothetical protein TSUD_340980 [Trifolium subterraneum]
MNSFIIDMGLVFTSTDKLSFMCEYLTSLYLIQISGSHNCSPPSRTKVIITIFVEYKEHAD